MLFHERPWLSCFSDKIVSTKLNLSSSPFRNRVLPWTVTGVVALASIVALLYIARATFQTNEQAQAAERDVSDLRQQMQALNRRAREIESTLTPEQKRTLKSAHMLVDRKRFSWSRLFSDLEGALPGSARVARITVKEVGADGDRSVADLDLVVVSKSAATITQMIKDMASEGVFRPELISQSLQRGRGETGEEYEMLVHYVPRSGAPREPATRNERPVDTAGEGSRSR
jgi:Tfp pilus assembly protein PilN